MTQQDLLAARRNLIHWSDAPKRDCARVDLPLLVFETLSYECAICQGNGHVRGIDCRVCGGLGVRRSS